MFPSGPFPFCRDVSVGKTRRVHATPFLTGGDLSTSILGGKRGYRTITIVPSGYLTVSQRFPLYAYTGIPVMDRVGFRTWPELILIIVFREKTGSVPGIPFCRYRRLAPDNRTPPRDSNGVWRRGARSRAGLSGTLAGQRFIRAQAARAACASGSTGVLSFLVPFRQFTFSRPRMIIATALALTSSAFRRLYCSSIFLRLEGDWSRNVS